MRVALIVNGFPDSSAAYRGIVNLQTAKALSALTDLRVIFLRTWRPGRRFISVAKCEYSGVPVITLGVPQLPLPFPIGFLVNIALYRRLGWPLLQSVLRNCDLIHSVDALPGIVASDWAMRARIHHVYQARGGDVNTIFPTIRTSRVIAGWDKHIHGVACVSRMLEAGFRSLYPHVQNVRTTYRGVNIHCFQPIGSTAGPLSNRPPVRYLFLGGFPSYPTQPYRSNTKGGETLLAVWKMAEEDMISANASLLLAGPQSNNERIADWRASLRQPERVYVADLLSPGVISDYIRAADVVLLPSMQEGLPGVAMEASACAKAVFGSNVGGIPEVVVHEETGVLLPAGDVTAWKQALVRYAYQPSLLKIMGERARSRMERLFDCNQYAPQMIDLYRTALHQPLLTN
jgi:glycosyltransferase involved in cell wall biosynthesis